jgi:DNA-cytosine methyltransferase
VKLRFVSLFAGIGAFDLGLQQTDAYELVGHVELDAYRRRVLAKRFPESRCLGSDIRQVGKAELEGLGRIHGFCGGFPCTDLSAAGRGAGILDGEHSSLWSEYFRLIGLCDPLPEVILIENVPLLLSRGMEVVVRDLTSLGYCVEWDCLPAAAFGAPHLRDRVWVVAHRAGRPIVFGRPERLFAEPLRGAEPGRDFMKWPRAGFTTSPEECLDLIPLAPLKRFKRGKAKLLWPHLDRDFIPTPVADDVKGGVVAHMRNKHGWDDAARTAITSLAVLARNGMEEATPEQIAAARASVPDRFPTPKESDAAKSRGDLTAVVKGRPNGHSGGMIPTPTASDARASRREGYMYEGNDGTTLSDYADQAERETFPTPTAQDGKNDGGPSQHERNSLPLNTHVKVYPTPEKSDGSGGRMSSEVGGTRPSGAKRAVTLATAAREAEKEERFRSPSARDHKNARAPEKLDTNGGSRQTSLGEQLADPESPEPHVRMGQLNPDWVEWLMGLPIGWTNADLDNAELRPCGWESEPEGVPRLVQGVPNRVARVSALGDSLVAAAAFWLGLAALRAVPSEVRPTLPDAAVAQSA